MFYVGCVCVRVCVGSVSCFTSLTAQRMERVGKMPSPSVHLLVVRWLLWKTRLNKVEEKWAAQPSNKFHIQTPSDTIALFLCCSLALLIGITERKTAVCFSVLCSCCYIIISAAYITMLLQGSSVGVWIGLRDEDTMKWTNWKSVTYTNWSPIEPKSYLTVSSCGYFKLTYTANCYKCSSLLSLCVNMHPSQVHMWVA